MHVEWSLSPRFDRVVHVAGGVAAAESADFCGKTRLTGLPSGQRIHYRTWFDDSEWLLGLFTTRRARSIHATSPSRGRGRCERARLGDRSRARRNACVHRPSRADAGSLPPLRRRGLCRTRALPARTSRGSRDGTRWRTRSIRSAPPRADGRSPTIARCGATAPKSPRRSAPRPRSSPSRRCGMTTRFATTGFPAKTAAA